MAITIGTQLGYHEVLALLGKGGMGEVYRARDTKLKREVAIKILPDEFARDPDRVLRFQREAEVLASLNHPNIGAIYDVQEAGGARFLVLELVEGDTLADRLQRPMAVDEALRIAKHICEALEAAHEKGVVHRDLKPGNVKITPDGNVKVLDFGLAKALEASPANATMSNSPTLTIAGTNAGVILGTAAYMSPEQARGRAADQRSDVFSFGCVLYEMLTGRQAFPGEEVSDVLASVLKTEPDWNLLPAKLNPRLHEVLRRCLQKNPKLRWHAIGDARVEIETVLADPRGTVVEESGVTVAKSPLWKRGLPIVMAIVLGAVVAGVSVWNFKPSPRLPIIRFVMTLGEGQQFSQLGTTELAISPDGTQVIYEANRQLYLRHISEVEARPIVGTQSTQAMSAPAFSPDGRSLVFWSLADLALKKIAVSGGATVTICPTNNFFGGSWGESGLVFANREGILRVSDNGGTPEIIIPVKAGEVAYGPQILPGGDSVLFTLAKGQGAAWENAQVVVQSLKTGERKVLIERGTDGRYVPTGHIVYALEGTLFARPFNVRRLQVTSGPVPLVEGVRAMTFQFGGGYHFNFSNTGTLVYMPGPRSTAGEQQLLASMDRKGTIEQLKVPPRPYGFPRVSPDGKRIAFGTDNGRDAHIWVYELSGTIAPRQLTVGGSNRFPVWSSDGEWIAYQSDREGDRGIFRQRADGSGGAERLTKPEAGVDHIPDSWSHDGQNLSLTAFKGTDASVWIYSFKDKKPTLFAQAPSRLVARAVFSPDDRWLAYQSNEVGRTQVWVQPFPATGAKYPVVDGGLPLWSGDGTELFYRAGPDLTAAIRITTSPNFAFSDPTPLSRGLLFNRGNFSPRNFDITPDGKRFIGVIDANRAPAASPVAPQIQLVINWFEDLKQRMSAK